MASVTPNLGLTEPAYTDLSDIQVLNGNFTILDNFAGSLTTGTGAVPAHSVESDAAAPAGGTAATLLRSDAQLVAYTLPPGTSLPGQLASQGSQLGLSRSDHQHARELALVQNSSPVLVGTSEVVVTSLQIPSSFLAAGSVLRVKLLCSCVSAATPTYRLRFGTTGTTADQVLNGGLGAALGTNAFATMEWLVNFLSVGASSSAQTSAWFASSSIAGLAEGQNNALASTLGSSFLTLTCQSTVASSIQTYGIQFEQLA